MNRFWKVAFALSSLLFLANGCGGEGGAIGPDPVRMDVPIVTKDITYPDQTGDEAGTDPGDVPVPPMDAVEAEDSWIPDLHDLDIPVDAHDTTAVDTPPDLDLVDEDVPEIAAPEIVDTQEVVDVEDIPGETKVLCPPNDVDCPCLSDEDCDPEWSGFCGENRCNKSIGICLMAPVKNDGTACDDGDACTMDDACKKGGCTGAPDPCDDGNLCTVDACIPGTGCSNGPTEGACEDGDYCHGPDTCEAGQCLAGPAVDCDDKNACTLDTCEPGSGCVFQPEDGACDDGNQCTQGDHCESGGCSPTGFVDCDDGNLCTLDGCDPGTGCIHTNSEGSCDDGDTCTQGDFCQDGQCQPGPIKQCFVCDDGDCDPDEDCKTCPQDCGECPPDCQTTEPLGCGAWIADTTVGYTNAIESYFNLQCISFLAETGPERVVPFVTGEDVWANIKMTGAGIPGLDLWVLGTNCAPGSCVAQSGMLGLGAETLFKPDPGKTYYLTVDGSGAAGDSFTLETECLEADCGDGTDNDTDGTTDCTDVDCGGALAACGQVVEGDIDRFSHAGGYSATCGNQSGGKDDAVFHFTLESAALVTVVADPDDSGDDLDVFVLKDGCTGVACVAFGIGSDSFEAVNFTAQPGTYYVVVEEDSATEDSNGNFTLTVTCQ